MIRASTAQVCGGSEGLGHPYFHHVGIVFTDLTTIMMRSRFFVESMLEALSSLLSDAHKPLAWLLMAIHGI